MFGDQTRPEFEIRKVLQLSKKQKTQLQKCGSYAASQVSSYELREALQKDMAMMERRCLSAKPRVSSSAFLSELLEEANDFWPQEDPSDADEILAAVRAFCQCTAWLVYQHKPIDLAEPPEAMLQMLRSTATLIVNQFAKLAEHELQRHHLWWSLKKLASKKLPKLKVDPKIPKGPTEVEDKTDVLELLRCALRRQFRLKGESFKEFQVTEQE